MHIGQRVSGVHISYIHVRAAEWYTDRVGARGPPRPTFLSAADEL